MKEAARSMQTNIAPALEVLKDIISDQEEKAQVKINAIDTFMRHFYRLEEITDIEARLETLENMQH